MADYCRCQCTGRDTRLLDYRAGVGFISCESIKASASKTTEKHTQPVFQTHWGLKSVVQTSKYGSSDWTSNAHASWVHSHLYAWAYSWAQTDVNTRSKQTPQAPFSYAVFGFSMFTWNLLHLNLRVEIKHWVGLWLLKLQIYLLMVRHSQKKTPKYKLWCL